MKIFGGSGSKASGRRLVSSAKANKAIINSLYELLRLKQVRIVIIVLGVLGVMCFGTALAWNMLVVKLPEIPPEEPSFTDDLPTFDNNPPVSPTPTRPPTQQATSEPVTLRKPGCYTFLLCGHADGYSTDTIMVGLLDTNNDTLNVVSVPRDTMVNVKRDIKKINSAYGLGNSAQPGQGVEQLIAELRTVIGFKPDYYAVVNMKAFTRLVDAVDGVTFEVPMRMYKQLDDGMLIDLQKGKQKLNGNQALQLVRWRDYNGFKLGNDFMRMHVQQELLKTLAKQVVQLKNVFKINEFIDIAEENLETDMKATDMLAFANELLSYDMDNINFYTLPTTSGKWYSTSLKADLWYEYVDAEKALEMINQNICPFVEPLTEEDLDILILQK